MVGGRHVPRRVAFPRAAAGEERHGGQVRPEAFGSPYSVAGAPAPRVVVSQHRVERSSSPWRAAAGARGVRLRTDSPARRAAVAHVLRVEFGGVVRGHVVARTFAREAA